MTNLWTTAAGRNATKEAVYSLIRRRMKRFFKRNFVVEFDAWVASGKTAFSFINTLGDLNDFHDTEILNLYELLTTIGELPETVANLDLYVNGSTGNDENGLGNSTTPFATVTRALQALKDTVISHRVRILVANPNAPATYTYTEKHWELTQQINEGGSLSIIGVSAPEVVHAAEALTGVTALGVGGLDFDAAAAGWGVNSWQGCWAVPQDGVQKDYGYAIQQNTATQLRGVLQGVQPGVGDSIEGHRPAITVNLDGLKIKTRCTNVADGGELKSPVAIVNLQLNFESSSDEIAVLDIDGDEQYVWLDFVSCIFDDGHVDDVKIKRAYVNYYTPMDTTLAATSLSNLTNMGTAQICPGLSCRRETPGLDSVVMAFIENSYIFHCTFPEYIYKRGNYAGSFIESCAMSGVICYTGTYIETIKCYLSNDGASAYIYQMCKAKIRGDYIDVGAKCVVADQVELSIGEAAQCDPLITNYGLEAGAGTTCVIDGTLAAFVGALGAVEFTAPNPNVVVAWPAAGAQVNDALISAWATQPG